MKNVNNIHKVGGILIGERGVGKHSLMRALCGEEYKATLEAADKQERVLEFTLGSGDKVQLSLSVGKSRHLPETALSMQDKSVLLFVYDSQDQDSWDIMPGWVGKADYAGGSRKTIRLMVGVNKNKEFNELEEKAKRIALQYSIPWCAVNNQDGLGIGELRSYIKQEIEVLLKPSPQKVGDDVSKEKIKDGTKDKGKGKERDRSFVTTSKKKSEEEKLPTKR
ncbi:MAG: hypothetical protein K0R63_1260 [Rickettsiales bacterium]|jgi:GTPase SAR1 family protein|nr:hypothetical protein [Rickettsiales bacterium]